MDGVGGMNGVEGKTQLIPTDGQRVAVRTYGQGPPLLLLNRFRGTMDDWDPALIGLLAGKRRVVVFDNVGVGETVGDVPARVEDMALFVTTVMRAVGTPFMDLLGWSLGGMVAQVLAIEQPRMVRKLVLAATIPPGGSVDGVWNPSWLERAAAPAPSVETDMSLFYTDSQESRAAGARSFSRIAYPPAARVSRPAISGQAEAIRRFIRGEGAWYTRLREIAAPTFVAGGDRDGLFPAIDAVVLAREIPNSQLAVYPDSGHAFLFQHVERFSEDVLHFLQTA